MSYCSLDEAFLGPANQMAPGKKSKKLRIKEPFVPTHLSDVPAVERPPSAEVLTAPPASSAKLEGPATDDFFPLPGDTETDSWENAFMLEPDFAKTHRQVPHTPAPVDGKSTLWRQIPVPHDTKESNVTPVPNEISHRLDTLTRQLESLSMPTPMQSTAELFLFVAIGLLLLLALDTLLRFATTMAIQKQRGGVRIRGRVR